jgi:hypothetical protein
MNELNMFGPSPTPMTNYAYHSNTGGPEYYGRISRPGLEPGFFGVQGVIPNVHDMFVDMIKPMVMQPQSQSVNGIGGAGDAAVFGAVTGGVLLLGAMSFLWAKYIGGWAIEAISDTKLSNKQKNAVGLVGLLLI